MDWGSGVTYIGEASLKGVSTRFGIRDQDRLERVTVIAKPQPRQALFAQMALQDAERGLGTLIVDPGGELSELFVERLHPDFRDRLIYIDPSEAEYPFSWNPVADYRTLPKDVGVAHLARLLASLYRTSVSPLIEFLATRMLNDPHATVLTLYELVAEPAMRDKLFPTTDPTRAEFDTLLKNEESTVSDIRTNGRYLAKDTLVRNLLGQEHSKFSLSSLREGAIVVLNLSRIRMFPTRITPLARLFTYAARAAAEVGPTPVALYLYECVRTFSEFDIEHIFSNRLLAVTLSDTLPTDDAREWRKRVLSRSGSVLAFSPNPNDIQFVEELFFPFIAQDDMDKLEPTEYALMLSIDSLRSRPFFARSLAMPPRSNLSYQDVQVFAREQHSTPRHTVDQFFVKKYAPPAVGGKNAEGGSFSNAFRSIFSKNAPTASAPVPPSGTPPAPGAPKIETPLPKADSNKKPQEVSEDELRDMLHVDPIKPD